MEPFARLGHEVEEEWQRRSYAEAAFPEIAARALERAKLPEAVGPTDVLRWVLSTKDLPPQADIDARFGEPPLTVYAGRRFIITVLFWLDGTTSIHEHRFSGAFQVLAGSSLHTRFAFSPERWLNEDFGFGSLRAVSMERLQRGDLHPIVAGSSFIHSLFHLDRPSVTVVVRTREALTIGAQHTYGHPGIAWNPFRKEEWTTRVDQVVKLFGRWKDPQTEPLLEDLLSRTDPLTTLSVFHRLGPSLHEERLNRLLGRLENPALAGALREYCRQSERVELIAKRRAEVRDPNHRYFLAVIMNATTRSQVLKMASALRPDVPAPGTVVRWLRELSEVTHQLKVGGAVWQPSVLGLPAADGPSLRALERALASSEEPDDPAALPFYQAVRQSPVFAPLFS